MNAYLLVEDLGFNSYSIYFNGFITKAHKNLNELMVVKSKDFYPALPIEGYLSLGYIIKLEAFSLTELFNKIRQEIPEDCI